MNRSKLSSYLPLPLWSAIQPMGRRMERFSTSLYPRMMASVVELPLSVIALRKPESWLTSNDFAPWAWRAWPELCLDLVTSSRLPISLLRRCSPEPVRLLGAVAPRPGR